MPVWEGVDELVDTIMAASNKTIKRVDKNSAVYRRQNLDWLTAGAEGVEDGTDIAGRFVEGRVSAEELQQLRNQHVRRSTTSMRPTALYKAARLEVDPNNTKLSVHHSLIPPA